MANLIDSPVPVTTPLAIGIAPNEVYKLDGADKVEGAMLGASNSGIGVSNLQAKQLAARITKLNNALQDFAGDFSFLTADVGDALNAGSGLLSIPAIWSTSPAATPLMVQFGRRAKNFTPSLSGASDGFNWPVAFPNSLVACLAWQVNPAGTNLGIVQVRPGSGCSRLQADFIIRYPAFEYGVQNSGSAFTATYNYAAIGR